MIDYKSMSTPLMIYNLKKLHDSDLGLDLVDHTMYKQLVGSLMYLIHSRPGICYAVSMLSQFMSELRHRYWVASKQVIRYLRCTIAYGLRYSSSGGVMLLGYVDSDWGGSIVD